MSDLLLFVTVTLITCATPGAGVLNTIANAFRYGWPQAWICPLGNAAGVAVMSAVSAAGL